MFRSEAERLKAREALLATVDAVNDTMNTDDNGKAEDREAVSVAFDRLYPKIEDAPKWPEMSSGSISGSMPDVVAFNSVPATPSPDFAAAVEEPDGPYPMGMPRPTPATEQEWADKFPMPLLDIIAAVRACARFHGYALAVHGSLSRDLDLLAVPWVALGVSTPQELTDAIIREIGGLAADAKPTERPHDPGVGGGEVTNDREVWAGNILLALPEGCGGWCHSFDGHHVNTDEVWVGLLAAYDTMFPQSPQPEPSDAV